MLFRSERIICTEYSTNIPDDINNRYQELIDERNGTDGLWGSIDKSLLQIEKLLGERDDAESQKILSATKIKIKSMKVGL